MCVKLHIPSCSRTRTELDRHDWLRRWQRSNFGLWNCVHGGASLDKTLKYAEQPRLERHFILGVDIHLAAFAVVDFKRRKLGLQSIGRLPRNFLGRAVQSIADFAILSRVPLKYIAQ